MDNHEWNQLINSMEEYLLKLERASISVSELFYEPINDESIKVMNQYFTGCNEITHALVTTLDNSDEYAPEMKEKCTPIAAELIHVFSHINSLFEKERLVAIADVLKYEIPQKLQSILSVIRETK